MVSTSSQLKEAIPASGGLIGSFYNGKVVQHKNPLSCPNCNENLLPESKFCGECGSANTGKIVQAQTVQAQTVQAQTSPNFGNQNLSSEYLNSQRKQITGMPSFAQVSPKLRRPISPELKQEYCKVTCLLARERVFLLFHYLFFLGGNLFGLSCAFKAYNGLVADEVTRVVIALVPMFFINTVSFSAVVPIGGTKKEIARLKDRITHLHYQIEYTNLS